MLSVSRSINIKCFTIKILDVLANSILTEGKHKYSRIKYINRTKVLKFFKAGGIPIIVGFQGVDKKLNITTIGRGGSTLVQLWLQSFLKLIDV